MTSPLHTVPSPAPTEIGGRLFRWGERTFVMGIVNVTPDSFSGDGLLQEPSMAITRAVEIGRRMVSEGADILDIGGESTRPGHEPVDEAEEWRRILPVIEAIHDAMPQVPISIDTTKASVAAAALDAGATLLNDVWGTGSDEAMKRLAADRTVPIVLMHNRADATYGDLIGEVLDDLQVAVDRAIALGVSADSIIVDPGFGFGKTAGQNLALLADLDRLRALGRPVLLGTSRKSTLGKVLDLPAGERVEATIATTALAIRSGVDIVRVHDVQANVRAARIADAVVRGWDPAPATPGLDARS